MKGIDIAFSVLADALGKEEYQLTALTETAKALCFAASIRPDQEIEDGKTHKIKKIMLKNLSQLFSYERFDK